MARWLFQGQKFERLELRTAAGTAAQQVAQKVCCIREGVLRHAWIDRTGARGRLHGLRSPPAPVILPL
ncbi:hypothetical protein SANTM175S_00584 [Streptomyces antimycoticus]